jgi:hypothetical protein
MEGGNPQMNPMYERAARLADRYNWPAEAAALRQGVIPEGFPREVGRTIALFLVKIPCFPPTEEEEQSNRAHAKQLAELRMMLATLGIAKRREQANESS